MTSLQRGLLNQLQKSEMTWQLTKEKLFELMKLQFEGENQSCSAAVYENGSEIKPD